MERRVGGSGEVEGVLERGRKKRKSRISEAVTYVL